MGNKDILQIAKDTISIESQGLKLLFDALDDSFVKAVKAITQCKGKVIVSGIGKSAHIAQKIVATFNSTGTLAVYMHAAEAIHGDLGMVARQDIVLILSKGGEGVEIKSWIPIIKRLKVKIISITANTKSYLSKNSDYCIITPTHKEDMLLNIVPTTSTTQQIALGDAIAVCLMYIKKFSTTQFANFHPGGLLGRKLLLSTKDICSKHGKPSVVSNTVLKDIIYEVSKHRLGATVVINKANKVIGIIADGDLRRMMQSDHIDWKRLTAKNIMTKNPKIIKADCLAVDALEIMEKYKITQLPVVNQKSEYVGIIHLHDLIEAGLYLNNENI